MTMPYSAPEKNVIESLIDRIQFDAEGLVAVIAQSAHAPHEILMMAWMNREALNETLSTGRVCYYSRSRQKLWRKGETSGQIQTLVAAFIDCDHDALLIKIHQEGVACHTGRRTCFFREITASGLQDSVAPSVSPDTLYKSNT